MGQVAGFGDAHRFRRSSAYRTIPGSRSGTVIGEETKSALRWVKVPTDARRLPRFPDFMIIGPQRTGTTWLHAHLRNHPQVFLSEPKELYFFSSLKTRDPKRFVSDELGFYLRFFRDPLWRRAVKTGRALWKYGELYRPLVRGEATASYAALEPDIIAEIAALNPQLKAILMIRNPIDRAWSHAKKDLLRNRNRPLEDVSEAEFRAFFTDDYQLRCAHYVDQYDQWAAYLRPDHVLVGAFDDIANRPEAFLLDVMRFLGVRAEQKYLDPSLREAVNPTGSERIPQQYRALLEELLSDDLRRLKERFGMSW
jgi:hypothetical protein